MKQALFITVLMVIALSTSVLAQPSAEPVLLDGVQGEDVSGQLVVTNTNDTAYVNVTITAQDLASGSNTLSASNIVFADAEHTIPAGQTHTFDFTISIPSDQAQGTYTGNVLLNYQEEGMSDEIIITVPLTLNVTTSNNPPVIESINDQTIIVNANYQYQIVASDPDDDTLTYAKVSTNPTSTLAVNSGTGLITWTPSITGTYVVNVSVSDSEEIVYESFTLTVIPAGGTIEFDDISMGSSSQERGETISKIFIISNSGAQDVTNAVLTTDAPSEYNVQFEHATTIPAGGSIQALITMSVPISQRAGVRDIGVVRANGQADGNSLFSVEKTLRLETVNHLIIDNARVTIDGRRRTIEDRDRYDVKPGDNVEFSIRVKNTFSDDMDIEDIEFYIDEDYLDWDDSETISRLADGRTTTFTFTFQVPMDADEDDSPFTVYLELEGEDENGAMHGEFWELSLDLEKERDNVAIRDLQFLPSAVTCNDENVRLNIGLINIGSRDQNTIHLRVTSNDLGYDSVQQQIRLDEGQRTTRTFTIPVKNVATGTYLFVVEAFTSGQERDLTDTEIINLFIGPCTTTTTPPTDTGDSGTVIDVVTPTTPPSTPPTGQIISSTTGRPSGFLGSNDGLYIGLLIGVIVLLVVLIIVFATVAMKK